MAHNGHRGLREMAAEHFAQKHHMPTHEAFNDPEFRSSWNDFLSHPHNKDIQRELGIGRRLRKEGEVERNNFRSDDEIWRHALVA